MDATASVSNRFDAHTNSLWLADIVTIALLIGFVVLIYVLEQFRHRNLAQRLWRQRVLLWR